MANLAVSRRVGGMGQLLRASYALNLEGRVTELSSAFCPQHIHLCLEQSQVCSARYGQ